MIGPLVIELRASPELLHALGQLAAAMSIFATTSEGAKTDTRPSSPATPPYAAQAQPAGQLSRMPIVSSKQRRGKGQVAPAANSKRRRHKKFKPPASSSSPRWSEERKAIVRREYPAGTSTDGIMAQLNALPGAPVSKSQMAVYASTSLKVARPPRGATVPPPGEPVPEPPPAEPVPEPPAAIPAPVAAPAVRQPTKNAAVPLSSSYEAILGWANNRGLQMQKLDLAAVNREAKRIGHPGFTLRQPSDPAARKAAA